MAEEGGRERGRVATQRKTRRTELRWYATFSSSEPTFFKMTPFNPAESTLQVKGGKGFSRDHCCHHSYLFNATSKKRKKRRETLLSQAVNVQRCLQAAVFKQQQQHCALPRVFQGPEN